MDYNYNEAVKEDVRSYIDENYSHEELIEKLSEIEGFKEELDDLLWANDDVTGNGSGSYTFDSYKAEEYLCHNLDLLVEASNELSSDLNELIEGGAENCDVTIRCYLLYGAINDVVDDLYSEYEDEVNDFIEKASDENSDDE